MSTPHPVDTHGEQARRIAGYEILSKLGQGGMGAVYKARQLSLDRTVALKVLPKQLTASQDFIQRFSREARVTGQLNHPNIIKVYDVGRSNTGICYYSMEYVEGESLRSVLDHEKRLGADTVLKILEEMASALAHAHKHGIIHRDIKPDNILIDREGASKLADLGLAKVAEDSGATAAAKGGGYASMVGQVVGTPFYMSPEQAEGVTVDTRSDLYSLGATAFHLLAGAPPFTAETPMGVITKHLTEPVPSVRARVPGTPPAVDALLKRLMAKLPEDRFQTPADLLAEVSRVRRELASSALAPAAAGPEEEESPAASRTPLLVGGGVLLAVLAVTAYAMRKKDPPVQVPTVVTSSPPLMPEQRREKDAQAAKFKAKELSGSALLEALRNVKRDWPRTDAARDVELQIRDIQHGDWERLKARVASFRTDNRLPEALSALSGFEPHADDRRELEGLRNEIQAALSAPPPAPIVTQAPPAPPPPPPVQVPAQPRTAEIGERLEAMSKADRAHDWAKVRSLADAIEKELGLEMQPGDLGRCAELKSRAVRNGRLGKRWTFDGGAEGWSVGAADGRPGPSGSLTLPAQTLRFGAPRPGGRFGGEVRSPLFTVEPGASLSVSWALTLFQGKGRPPSGPYAYACLRDDKGRVLGEPLRKHHLRKDWRDDKQPVSLNFLAYPVPAGRPAQVQLCFGFYAKEKCGFSAAMVLDDIEVFYGEDAK